MKKGFKILSFVFVTLTIIPVILGAEAGLNFTEIEKVTAMKGHRMGNAMGVNTWAAFVGSDTQAVVDGDFAMLENELQGVLKTLLAAKIRIVAIHNHMTTENPRILFLHFWGAGKTTDLARGLKAALATQTKE
ncbi:PF07485 domain protein [Leptospira weilii serovar Ranarum str. ICFT]|uniref:PF07485 domain protein n=1 Tax=Leptospira weilii serovar Ranarum str. ICFT TaxID=1218598 RepID=N1WP68_9LEPT|nr:DUF1259 domain-containing protein [Leptospira weilii]EMY77608.1 PF07485 domain protein [Leptospira weilii serovar Ranarum str. ICFT]